MHWAIFCIVMMAAPLALGDQGTETELRDTLRRSYDKAVLPSRKLDVTIHSFKLQDIDMHEDSHSVDVHCWFGYMWNDERLKWDPEAYGGIDRLAMDPDEVWRPDISLYNGAGNTHLPESNLPTLVFSHGSVMHIPSLILKFYCIMDLTYWPHDSHLCELKLGSWVHHGHIIDYMTNGSSTEVMAGAKTLPNGKNITRTEWTVSDLEIKREVNYYDCCPEPYISVTISFLATRCAPAYGWIVKAPVACMSILTLVVFLLPPSAGEKIVFGGLCLILEVLFINYTAVVVGHAPSHTPLIVQLVCQQIILVMISVVMSAMVMRMARGPHSSGLPNLLKRPALLLSSFLCLGNYSQLVLKTSGSFANARKPDEVELGEDSSVEIRRQEVGESHEWLLLAAVVDRLALILYAVICVISLIRFSSVL